MESTDNENEEETILTTFPWNKKLFSADKNQRKNVLESRVEKEPFDFSLIDLANDDTALELVDVRRDRPA